MEIPKNIWPTDLHRFGPPTVHRGRQVFHLDWIRDVGGVVTSAPSIDTGSPENVAAKVSDDVVEVLESWDGDPPGSTIMFAPTGEAWIK